MVLTPEMGIQLIGSGIYGPLPDSTFGLLLGHSSLTKKGLIVHSGVIDSDYTGEIKIMTSTQTKIIDLPIGTRIAQLLIIPFCNVSNTIIKSSSRNTGGFGSSDAYWVQAIKSQRPEMSLKIQRKKFTGLLDTGADVSVISL